MPKAQAATIDPSEGPLLLSGREEHRAGKTPVHDYQFV